ncbi:MAG: AAA family ATPase [Eubacteriales bacterium]|nr:AAA family ATPase [Eubacteriales bacterium]
MNIKRAKEEIRNSIEAYLSKNEYGEYRIPPIRQRPLLLIGPPGIGKTQIMEQIARENKLGLVSYTITHHTRQSAIGLPFIREKEYGGKSYSVTEYTMSEIIASVYDKMEQTGLKEGILFIDEINCVSETLAPAMLQFLQCKTFGNQKVPEGWIIVAAGNPPEYNKSVREFDVVTLDRIKKIEVEADFSVWKEYAYESGIHNAVISYLELKKEYFYKVETTVDGKLFATARGWEDLSQLIRVYEDLGKTIDREVIYQYIQHWRIAKDFANYLELYYKYRKDYRVKEILEGRISDGAVDRIRRAAFDEKLSVIGLLLAALHEQFETAWRFDQYVTGLYGQMKKYKKSLALDGAEVAENQKGGDAAELLAEICEEFAAELGQQKKAEHLTREEEHIQTEILHTLEGYRTELKGEGTAKKEEAFARVKEWFGAKTRERTAYLEKADRALNCAFDFMERAFGDSQEMVVFITELNTDYFAVWFVDMNGCDRFYKYNKSLLFSERQKGILQELAEIEAGGPF